MGGAVALGIDIGTSGVRAAVLDDRGRLLGHGAGRHRPRMAAARAEQAPAAWVRGAFAAGRDAVRQAGVARLDAVGVGALGPAPVLLDAAGAPLTPALLYGLDRRA